MQWFCEFAIPILAATVAWYWHLVDDILDCSSSRDTVSKYEVAPVETCPDQCLRCDMFLLIHFASGVRNKKGTAAVLYWFYSGSVEAQMVYLARVSTCPCFRILLNSVYTYTLSVSRLVEENRPKTGVQWKKMK